MTPIVPVTVTEYEIEASSSGFSVNRRSSPTITTKSLHFYIHNDPGSCSRSCYLRFESFTLKQYRRILSSPLHPGTYSKEIPQHRNVSEIR